MLSNRYQNINMSMLKITPGKRNKNAKKTYNSFLNNKKTIVLLNSKLNNITYNFKIRSVLKSSFRHTEI